MSKTNNASMKSKTNIIAIALIVAIIIGVFIIVERLSNPGDNSDFVAIVHDGEGEAHELPLNQDDTLTIITSYGTNTVEVKNHGIHMVEADCDNQDCIHQGEITSPGKQIICLPHKLWIEIVTNVANQGQMDTNAVNTDDADESSYEETFDSLSR